MDIYVYIFYANIYANNTIKYEAYLLVIVQFSRFVLTFYLKYRVN